MFVYLYKPLLILLCRCSVSKLLLYYLNLLPDLMFLSGTFIPMFIKMSWKSLHCFKALISYMYIELLTSSQMKIFLKTVKLIDVIILTFNFCNLFNYHYFMLLKNYLSSIWDIIPAMFQGFWFCYWLLSTCYSFIITSLVNFSGTFAFNILILKIFFVLFPWFNSLFLIFYRRSTGFVLFVISLLLILWYWCCTRTMQHSNIMVYHVIMLYFTY